jgi:NRAMP (natural resistance-associated macrophage protein)-like metal ion transporter
VAGGKSKSGLFARFGPGLIAGAANDDPSCLLTYLVAGAQFGFATLWTSLWILPAVATMQRLCSRLAMVSGRGLAGNIRVHMPRWVLWPVCLLLAGANVVTLAADLGGMAETTRMVLGGSEIVWTLLYAAGSVALLIYLPYRQIERALQWLCLTLLAYVVAALMTRPDWGEAFRYSIIPFFQPTRGYWLMLIAIAGASLSPYFLFWQAAQEVEQEISKGRRTVVQRQGATNSELRDSKADAYAGSFVAKLITYFVTLTAAATLHPQGIRELHSAEQAAQSLVPVAGQAASWLFAIGIVGTGLLAVPALAGSCAYAVSEGMRWRASLEEKPTLAPKFYGVLAASVGAGLAFIFFGVQPVQMLFIASLINGLLAPVVIVITLLLVTNPEVMGDRAIGGLLGSVMGRIQSRRWQTDSGRS